MQGFSLYLRETLPCVHANPNSLSSICENFDAPDDLNGRIFGLDFKDANV
jgi:hypothetical protein